jgi:hypothetical protein
VREAGADRLELGRRIGAVRKINGCLYGALGRKFYKRGLNLCTSTVINGIPKVIYLLRWIESPICRQKWISMSQPLAHLYGAITEFCV